MRRWLDRMRNYTKKTVGGGSVRPCYMEAYVIVFFVFPLCYAIGLVTMMLHNYVFLV